MQSDDSAKRELQYKKTRGFSIHHLPRRGEVKTEERRPR
jgi:hypothetical protein